MERGDDAVVVPWSARKSETGDGELQPIHAFQICPHCLSLDHEAIQDRGWPKPSLADVEKSAGERCQCCHFLYHIVRDFDLLHQLGQKSRPTPSLSSPVLVITAASGSLSLKLEAERAKSRSSEYSFVASKPIKLFRHSEGTCMRSTAKCLMNHSLGSRRRCALLVGAQTSQVQHILPPRGSKLH